MRRPRRGSTRRPRSADRAGRSRRAARPRLPRTRRVGATARPRLPARARARVPQPSAPGNRAGASRLATPGGVLMMLLAVVIDPIAVRGDRWFLGRIFYYVEERAYFGVPPVNFAGWALVGTLAIGGYVVLTRDARGTRPEPGMALYYAVLAFNLAVTAWIREWVLLGLGLLLHAVTAAVLYAVRRRPAVGPGMESQKA